MTRCRRGYPTPDDENVPVGTDRQLNGIGERIDYERWYPKVPAVMDTRQLADEWLRG